MLNICIVKKIVPGVIIEYFGEFSCLRNNFDEIKMKFLKIDKY